ncbi:MAG: aldehyde dehydrogenase family protein, partial [Flavobacteriaceae bacterium]
MEPIDILTKQRDFFNTQQTKVPSYRKKSLQRLAKVVKQHESEIYKVLDKDLGKPKFESYITEYLMIVKEIKTMVGNLERWSLPERQKSSVLNFPSKDYLIPEPYGCTLHISPWNYPFQLSLATLVGAVAAGNTVVLKPSEHAPATSALLAKIITLSFEPEHVSVVEGDASAATALLDLRWDHIFFTGSTHVGKIIAKAAAKHLTPTILELGGKNPCIVDATAPIKLSAKRIVWGKYLNCGQTCIAPDYLLVEESIKEQLIKAIVTEITQAFGENPEDSSSYGRIAHQKHFNRMRSLIQDSPLIYGGQYNTETRYFCPTVLEVKDQNHPCMKDEIFGPILPILTYKKESEIDSII